MSYSILVVDDSEIIRQAIKKSISMSGLDIGHLHEAGNGVEALKLLADQWVDIVLTDINMPEMTGVELVQRMRQDNVLSQIPVVVVSTERSITRIQELEQQGIKGYIKKPFRPEDLRDTISRLLEQKEGV